MIENFTTAQIKLKLVNYMNSNKPRYTLRDSTNNKDVILEESNKGHTHIVGSVRNNGLDIHFNQAVPDYIRMIILMSARHLSIQNETRINKQIMDKIKHKKLWNADELRLFCLVYDEKLSKKLNIIEPLYKQKESVFLHWYHKAQKWHKKYNDLVKRTSSANVSGYNPKLNAKLQKYRDTYHKYNVKSYKASKNKYSKPSIKLERLSEGCWGLIFVTMSQALSTSRDAFRSKIYRQAVKDHSLLIYVAKDKAITKELSHIVDLDDQKGNTLNLSKLIESAKKVAEIYDPVFNKLAKFSKQDYLKYREKHE